jgi:hypothetical protein
MVEHPSCCRGLHGQEAKAVAEFSFYAKIAACYGFNGTTNHGRGVLVLG